MPHNRMALYSFVAALLTLIAFCIGFLPIPLTAVACYPVAGVAGVAALITGGRALQQLRMSGERGQWMAYFGLIMGALTLLAVACLSVTMAALYPYVRTFIEQMFNQGK